MARRYIQWKHHKEKILNVHAGKSSKVWMMIASADHEFQWAQILDNGGIVEWTLKSVKRNFYTAQKGDKVLCYTGAGKDNGFVGLAEVEAPFDGENLKIKGKMRFQNLIPYEDFKLSLEYLNTQAGKMKNRGTLFDLTDDFVDLVRDHLLDSGEQEAAPWLDCPRVKM